MSGGFGRISPFWSGTDPGRSRSRTRPRDVPSRARLHSMRGYGKTSQSQWNISFLPCEDMQGPCEDMGIPPRLWKTSLLRFRGFGKNFFVSTKRLKWIMHNHVTPKPSQSMAETGNTTVEYGRVASCSIAYLGTNSSACNEKCVSCKCNFKAK